MKIGLNSEFCQIWPKYCNAVKFGGESVIKITPKPGPSQGNSNNVINVINHSLTNVYVTKINFPCFLISFLRFEISVVLRFRNSQSWWM